MIDFALILSRIFTHITYYNTIFAHADDTPTMPELTQLNMTNEWGHIRIKDRIAGHLQDVGTCLLNDKNGNMLDSIERDYDCIHDKVTEMFRLWLQGQGQKDDAKSITWSKLIKCLNVAQLQSLADEIKSVLCGRKRVTMADTKHKNKEKRVEPTTQDSIDLDISEGIADFYV